MRVKVKSLDSSRLRATVRVFFNGQGFDLRISPEPPNHIGRPRILNDNFLDGGLGNLGRRSDWDTHHGPNSGSEEDHDQHDDRPPRPSPPLPLISSSAASRQQRRIRC